MSASAKAILPGQIFQAPRDPASQNSGYLSRAINRHLAGWEVTSIQMVEAGFFLFNCFFISYLDTQLGCTSRVFSVIKPQNYSWLVQKVIRLTVYPVVYFILEKGVNLISSPITRSVTKPVRDLKIEKMRSDLDALLQRYEEKGGTIRNLSVKEIDEIHAEVKADPNYDAKEDEVDTGPQGVGIPFYTGPLNKIKPTDMRAHVMTGTDRKNRRFVVFRVSHNDEGTISHRSRTVVLDDKRGCEEYVVDSENPSGKLDLPPGIKQVVTIGGFSGFIKELSNSIENTGSEGRLFSSIDLTNFTADALDKPNENPSYLTRLVDERVSTWRIDTLKSVIISLYWFRMVSTFAVYIFSIRPRFNATWLRDSSSLNSIFVHLFAHDILQKIVVRAFSPIKMSLLKIGRKKMKTLLNEIVEKCREKKVSVKEFRMGEVSDIHNDTIGLEAPLTSGVDGFGKAFQVLYLKDEEETPFTLTLAVSLSLLDCRVYVSDKNREDLTELSFEALAEKLKKIVEGTDNTYTLCDSGA